MPFQIRLADKTSLEFVIATPNTLRRLIAGYCRARPKRRRTPRVKPVSLWEVLEAGVLRDFCTIEFQKCAGLLGISLSST